MSVFFHRSWFKILVLFLVWCFALIFLSYIFTQEKILPFSPSYPRLATMESLHPQPFIHRWAAFDGFHYLVIAQQGYLKIGGVQAFFPLYPLLIRLFTPIFSSPLLAGIFISSLSLYGLLLLSFQLIKEKYDKKLAWWFIIILLLSPASFFMLAVYSESLFLFLTFATFYSYYRRKFHLVAFFGLLLSATRIIGILVPFAIGLDYLLKIYQTRLPLNKENCRHIFLIFLSSFGLLFYMAFLWYHFNDPFYFRTVQEMFGSGREIKRFILLPQVYFRYLKMFYYGLPLNWKTYAIIQELALTTFYLLGLVYTFWQNWRMEKPIYPWSWWLFSFFAFIVPTSTGNFSSMTRYVLVCFVVTICLAKFYVRHPKVAYFLSFVSLIIMMINLLLFLQGFWVA